MATDNPTLTPARERLLRTLGDAGWDWDWTASRLAEVTGMGIGEAAVELEAAEDAGLVRWYAFAGLRLWVLTDAGRAWLDAHPVKGG